MNEKNMHRSVRMNHVERRINNNSQRTRKFTRHGSTDFDRLILLFTFINVPIWQAFRIKSRDFAYGDIWTNIMILTNVRAVV